jgi:YesN/AraC family two-component response regulator
MKSLKANRYDLVVLDIRMPDMDGLDVLKEIREKDLAEKVIMLTGVNELKLARDALALGADDFLTKPYDFKKLLECIDRVMKE